MRETLKNKHFITTLPRVSSDLLFIGTFPNEIKQRDLAELKKDNMDYTRKMYESMGIEIIEIEDDQLYRVALPEGWCCKHTGGYWSYVVDNKGKKKLDYFCKCEFRSREAFITSFYYLSKDTTSDF